MYRGCNGLYHEQRFKREINLPSEQYFEIIKEGDRQNGLKDDELDLAYGSSKKEVGA